MASDYWSRKVQAGSRYWLFRIIMRFFIVSYFLSLVLADNSDDTLAARNDIFKFHSDNQIILQPETSSDAPTTEQNELTFVFLFIRFTLSTSQLTPHSNCDTSFSMDHRKNLAHTKSLTYVPTIS